MRYGALTDATGPDVISLAVEAFGPAGHGLNLVARDLLSARFESPVGHVALDVVRNEDRRTEVVIETREFDREVRMFIKDLPQQSWISRLARRLYPSR